MCLLIAEIKNWSSIDSWISAELSGVSLEQPANKMGTFQFTLNPVAVSQYT